MACMVCGRADSSEWHAWYAGAMTHRNGMSGMRGMLAGRNAWYASVVQYKVQ